MVQAKRRSQTIGQSSGHSGFHGLGMLVVGIVIGSLATILWQGMRNPDGGVGTGIRQMIEQSKKQDESASGDQNINEEDKPVKQETNFDFFTVLPEIEVVVPSVEPDVAVENSQPESEVEGVSVETVVVNDTSSYMLQAGSYRKREDADQLKAELALKGLASNIQKVSIQGRGDFYRIRLGPYNSHKEMEKADLNLANQDIKTLRLKISKGG